MELAKGEGIAVVLVGPRDEGRLAGRAQDARAPRRRRPRPRGRALRRAAARPGLEEPLRLDRGGRGVRDGRGRHVGGDGPGPRVPRRARRAGARQRRRADARGQPADPRRGPGARRRRARSGRRGERRAASIRTGSRCSSPSSAGGPGSGSPVTTSTSTSPAACPSGSPASTCRSRSPSRSSLRDRPVRDRTVAIGEVGLLGELRPVAGLERRLREAARLGFRRAVVPRAAREGRCRPCAGIEIVAVASLREAIGAALEGAPSAWRAPRRDARLTAAPPQVPSSCPSGTAGGRSEGTVIRNIRLLGIALGGLVGLALARPAGLLVDTPSGGIIVTPSGGIWLIAWIAAWLVVGFAILPYLTIVPATWLFRGRPAAVHRRVRDRGRRAAPRPAHGPAARPAALRVRGPARDVAAARRLAVPRPRDARA